MSNLSHQNGWGIKLNGDTFWYFSTPPGCAPTARIRPVVSLPTTEELRRGSIKTDENLPVYTNSRVCNAHFFVCTRRYLRSDDPSTLPTTTTPIRRRKSPKRRKITLILIIVKRMIVHC